jgi:hypothetical protein
MEVRSLRGQRIDALAQLDKQHLKGVLEELDEEVVRTLLEIVEGKEVTALQEDNAPCRSSNSSRFAGQAQP